MVKIKTEFIVENGIEMEVNYFSYDGTTICGIVKTPVSDVEPEELMFEVTQLDRIEAQTAYIAMMMDGGDI